MPSLDELESGRARLSATYQSITVNFEYFPDRVGMNLQRGIAAVTRPPHDMGPIADELANILAAWDLTRKGEPIPITPEGIGSLPMGISSAIGREIMEDFHDPKSRLSMVTASASSTVSPPSSRPDASDSVPTGLTTSYEQNGRASIQPISQGSLTPVGS
jgi:hypothetical protein